VYRRGQQRVPFFRFISFLGQVPPLSWTPLQRIVPLPLDVVARGVARITLDADRNRSLFYARDLRRLNRRDELVPLAVPEPNLEDTKPRRPFESFDRLDEDVPFGWVPPQDHNA
jgi:hypothetical protein